MPAEKLFQRDWKHGVVYLFQFPRAGCIPSVSPFSLKMETWLRIADIPYQNVSTEFSKTSTKGQVPFIEYNGRQHADTSHIIEFLTKEFRKEDLDSNLTQIDKAHRQAFHHLLENSIVWEVLYNRSREGEWMFSDKGLLAHFSGIKKIVAQKIVGPRFAKRLAATVHTQGYGRHSIEEIEELMCKDLHALSVFLGEKPYFFGEDPSSFDATAFGILGQVFFAPLACKGVLPYANQNCKNLTNWMNRMRSRYWGDWEEATQKLSLDSTKWKELSHRM